MKNISAILTQNGSPLPGILHKIAMLKKVHAAFLHYLPPHFRSYCQVANLSGNTLILLVANGSIATQLRFQSSELLARCNRDPALKTVKAIQCKVSPQMCAVDSKHEKQPMPRLSNETAKVVREIADSLEDQQLKAIMQRIAERV